MQDPTRLAAEAENSLENAEWRDALTDVVETDGEKRAAALLSTLLEHARALGVPLGSRSVTPYGNTIPLERQGSFPGDLALEERLTALMRWNALAMVVRANNAHGELGGHIASYASAADLFEVGFNHFFRGPRAEGQAAIRQMLGTVSLPSDEEFLRRYPSQMSVGQAQRVLIGMAVLHRPALLLADEPTSALDPVTQAEILKLFADLSRRLDMSILYISHDLLSVAAISHRVAVLSAGQIVEWAETAQVFRNPQHPYTRALVESIPLQALNELAGRPAARGAASGQSF